MSGTKKIEHLLKNIYGEKNGSLAFQRIIPLLEAFKIKERKNKSGYFSEKDVFLITYADTLHKKNELPLETFSEFAFTYLENIFSCIHFLPFFPSSSDDGFSVIDFYTIDPEIGTWDLVSELEKRFRLMFDFVINHFSSKSNWFNYYLNEKKGYKELAIEVDPETDLSMVTRPRSLPLLTEYTKINGKKVHLWTTFSADQIDFNFKSLDVLEKMIDVALFYLKKGASVIRLDAIAYLWKETGTNCIHLDQTHDIVRLLRSIFDITCPDTMIITETNVPHDENISYFGNGNDEAQMVYNFTLPPLLLYSFIKEDTTKLSRWAKGLKTESETNTFFNFTASHDGIGVRPLEGILSQEEIGTLLDIVKANGGQVSYKDNPDGSQSPYELNITYIDALWKKEKDSKHTHAAKFLASQAIEYSLPGVPATYIHSLVGSRNWTEGVKKTGRARTINRQKLEKDSLLNELNDAESFRSKIFFNYLHMIKIRRKQKAFHPNAAFKTLEINPAVFAIKRSSNTQTIYSITNISSSVASISISEEMTPKLMQDLISGKTFKTDELTLEPYQYLWLTETNPTKNEQKQLHYA